MRSLLPLFLVLVVLTSCSDVNKLLKSNDYSLKTKRANQYYDAKKYEQAQILYEDVMPVIKGSAEYEDLYYKWTYCHYYQRDFLNAENLFKGFVENFPSSPRAEEAEFMRAYCHYRRSPKPELDQMSTNKAITFLQTFINTHPTAAKTTEAKTIIEELYKKLEMKDYRNADLYYDLGYYKASATSFAELLSNFPDSQRAEEYKLMVVKSWYKYAENSIENKQEERYETVLNECADFGDLFPDSKLQHEVDKYKSMATNKLKNIKNEQTKASAER
jgi:outer membrane protein assembly factor BamD